MNVTNWYCNWWIVPPIFLVGPTFADVANSQLRLGVDWCAHHQDSEHASQTEDCSWNFELNLFPRIDEPRCPFFFGRHHTHRLRGRRFSFFFCLCFVLDATYIGRLSLFRFSLVKPLLQVGLGCNKIPLQQIDFHSLHASYGLGWNFGIAAADEVLTEALTTTDLHWDRQVSDAWWSELLVQSRSSTEDWEETLLVIDGSCSLRMFKSSYCLYLFEVRDTFPETWGFDSRKCWLRPTIRGYVGSRYSWVYSL